MLHIWCLEQENFLTEGMSSENQPISLVLGIDAFNISTGGGNTHLKEILNISNPNKNKFRKVVVWGGRSIIDDIEDREWLLKVYKPILDKNLLFRLFWHIFFQKRCAKQMGCDVLLLPGGINFSRFSPAIVMSRNMLPFEWKELMRYGYSLMTLKLLVLRVAQSYTFKHADRIIFLTHYAQIGVTKVTGRLSAFVKIIPHGLNERFLSKPKLQKEISMYSLHKPFNILYVSSIEPYKHQDKVIEAVSILRSKNIPVFLHLVGAASDKGLARINSIINTFDPLNEWVNYNGEVLFKDLHKEYADSDLGIFASSCENMPNILLEMMASGLPVACSNLGPMPEILKDSGLYFNPEDVDETALTLLEFINSKRVRSIKAKKSYLLSQKYTWKKCSEDTLDFLEDATKSI
jgi:glycosyltransferase involved in cell wall biosynthesis